MKRKKSEKDMENRDVQIVRKGKGEETGKRVHKIDI